jgi:hypothetical protein
MIADIAAIAGAWNKAFGDEAVTDLTAGFTSALDVFDEGGHMLRAMISSWGGATTEELRSILKQGEGGFKEFFMAQVTAVQNLKEEYGDRRFTQLAGIFAEQFGTSREELMRMSQMDLGDLREQIEKTRASLENTEGVREAWDRMMGIFNQVWERISNITEALMVGLGEPALRALLPLAELFDQFLVWVVELLGSLKKSTVVTSAWALAWSAVASAIKLIGWGLLVTIITAVGTAISYVGALMAPLIPIILKVGAVVGLLVGALVLLKKAWDDFAGPIIDVISTVLSRMFDWYKSFLQLFLVLNPITTAMVALATHWDDFMAAMQPGLDAIAVAWVELREAFADAAKSWRESLGDMSGETIDFFDVFSGVLSLIAKGLGKIIGAVAFMISALLFVLKPVVKILEFVGDIIFTIIGAIDKAISTISGFLDVAAGFWGLTGGPDLSAGAITPVADVAQAGGIVSETAPVLVHKGEIITPIEKLPQVVGQTVMIPQDQVVKAIENLEKNLIRALRKDGGDGSLWALAKGIL